MQVLPNKHFQDALPIVRFDRRDRQRFLVMNRNVGVRIGLASING